jgi:hypothetical protein
MKKIAILHGELNSPLRKKAIELLSELLLDYTMAYPACIPVGKDVDLAEYRCIYIGTAASNPAIAARSDAPLTKPESYRISVRDDVTVIEGYDDAGVLYGCMDFYNRYITAFEYPHHPVYYWKNPFEKDMLPDFYLESAPAVKDRGLWTWGHVIYDYRGYIDHLLKLKMNTLIIWNDRVPVNAAELIAYAHSCNIKVIWGYAWGWENGCHKVDLQSLFEKSADLLKQYEEEYAALGGDGIYFQSATEIGSDTLGGLLVADAVTQFVNQTAALFYERYPDLEIQFGLHATSVKNRLEYIERVDPRIRIVWEDCGAFPFAYIPKQIGNFDETVDFVRKIAVLRGENDRFGVVTKGLTKLFWPDFEHMPESLAIGVSSEAMKENRVIRKRRIWKYLQAYWLTHADKVYEMIRAMSDAKNGNLTVTALVEDGMFEENIMYPVALYAEMLWDQKTPLSEMMTAVALRSYITFA